MYKWPSDSVMGTVMLRQISVTTVMSVLILLYFYQICNVEIWMHSQKCINIHWHICKQKSVKHWQPMQTWNNFPLIAFSVCPFLNQSFFQSAAWHQISWSEADPAPFPRWCVPRAVSRSHELSRRAHPCGKGQQRYMGHLTDLHTSPALHSIIHYNPSLHITFILLMQCAIIYRCTNVAALHH